MAFDSRIRNPLAPQGDSRVSVPQAEKKTLPGVPDSVSGLCRVTATVRKHTGCFFTRGRSRTSVPESGPDSLSAQSGGASLSQRSDRQRPRRGTYAASGDEYYGAHRDQSSGGLDASVRTRGAAGFESGRRGKHTERSATTTTRAPQTESLSAPQPRRSHRHHPTPVRYRAPTTTSHTPTPRARTPHRHPLRSAPHRPFPHRHRVSPNHSPSTAAPGSSHPSLDRVSPAP